MNTYIHAGQVRRRAYLMLVLGMGWWGGAGRALAQSGGSAPILRDMTFEQLANLTVTSVSKSEEAYFTSAAAVHVVTNEDIRHSGATTVTDALRTIPGVEVAMINSRSYAVTIRGFNGTAANKLLTLVDGRSLYSLRFASTIWDIRDVPLEDVEQIEVINGPGGTTWGANAVNGVINIVSRNARDTQGEWLSLTAGTFETAAFYARQGMQLNDHSWLRVFLKGFQRDDSEPVNRTDNNDAWGLVRGGFRYDRQREGAQTMVTGDYFFSEADQFIGLESSVARSRGGHVLYRYQRDLPADAHLFFQTYLDSYRRDSGGNYTEADTLDVDALHEFFSGESHQLSWGANLRRSRLKDRVNSPGFSSDFVPLVRYLNQGGFFIQDVIHPPATKLTCTAGAKAEYNDFTQWEFMPSLRLAWTPSERATGWASVSRAVRTPSRFESDQAITISGPGVTSRTLPSPDLEAESLYAYELGGRWRLGSAVTVDASVFCHDYDALVTSEVLPAPSPGQTASRLENLGTGFGCGAELSIQWQAHEGWRLRATWSHLNLETELDPASTDTILVSSEYLSPKNQFSLSSSWNLGESWEVDVQLRHVDELPQPGRLIPAYREADLRIGKQFGEHTTLSFVGQNLLDASHPEFRFFTTRAEVARSFYLRLDWRH
jgi:iron complex outermembrane receptor protein